MTTQLTCYLCDGTGSANNPTAFYNEGEAPQVSINCEWCKGKGYLEVESPIGIRVSVLVAKKIKNMFPQFRSWEEVYPVIVTNISSAVYQQSVGGFSFEKDTVFSEDVLPIDATLERWIEKGSYLEEAKTILGIKD
jgi:hypothetical protein